MAKGKGKGPGRPLKFDSLELLQLKIDDYFAWADNNKRPYTITGLALFLDTSRETLMNYEAKEQYFDTIKRAKLRVENYAEERVYSGQMVAGPIFVLKNFGWKDKQDIDSNTNVTFTVVDSYKETEEKDDK